MPTQERQLRRNGMLQACEPCRKRKIRCDHGLPTCGRCRKRKQEALCEYHPAPLTQTNESRGLSTAPAATNWTRTPMFSPSSNVVNAAPTTSATNSIGDVRTPDSPFGYLGSTSFSEVFKAGKHTSNEDWLAPLVQVKRTLRTPARCPLNPDQVNSGIRLLGLLSDCDSVVETLERYYKISQLVVAPWNTIHKATETIIKTLRDEKTTKPQRLVLVENIFAKTGELVELNEHLTAETFHFSFTGPNLRWEILGILFTYLALGLKATESQSEKQNMEREPLINELVHASNLSISFCEQAEAPNDLLVWLLYANCILLTIHYGDTSHLAWRRHGELASTIMAAGIHQEPSNDPRIPFFLGELRKRVFANSYSSDKLISTFVGRPPQLSIKYCTINPPLDLSDEELIASPHGEELIASPHLRNLAVLRLDSNGWSTGGTFSRQTWARIKLALNIIREEVLELSLVAPSPDLEQSQKAQAALGKAQATWNSFPDFAKYDDSCWESSLPTTDCFTLLYHFLHINFSEFLLFRIQARHGGSWGAVHSSASKLLSTVLIISKHRDRIGGQSQDFALMSIFYGLPSAALLAIEILRQKQQHLSPSAEIPRSKTITDICVFIASLEWVAKPDDGNYGLCQGAKVMFGKLLDSILAPDPVTSIQEIQQVPSDPVSWIDDMFSSGWMASGPLVESTTVDFGSMYNSSLDWSFQF